MSESIHTYVVDQLQKRKGQWPKVAEDTGIPKRSIEKIARLEWKNPGVTDIETLTEYFRNPSRFKRARRRVA